MNEQIKELAAQALQLVADEHTNGDESRLNTDSYQVKDLIQDKFAELLLLEAYRVATSNPNISTSLAGKRMLEHFGVKE
jgi:hypothetical protein